MNITFFRSSSYNLHDWCPHKFFIVYCLGHTETVGIAAEKGTITHKILECMAIAKKCLQEDQYGFTDEAVGEINFTKQYLYTDAFVDELTTKAFNYYHNKSEIKEKYSNKDAKEIRIWVQKVINSEFDPRILQIVAPEQQFDLEIPDDWAQYNYVMPDGKILAGHLRVKGTIDLIISSGKNLLEVCDWKTGAKVYDWYKQYDKSYEHLMHDPQLMLYYYAASRLYPNDQVMMTINYIRAKDGGAFTMAFDDTHKQQILQLIRRKFEEIKLMNVPPLTVDWRCTKLCHFGKTKHPDSHKTICQHIADKIRKVGINEVTRTETRKGFALGDYSCPGA